MFDFFGSCDNIRIIVRLVKKLVLIVLGGLGTLKYVNRLKIGIQRFINFKARYKIGEKQ